MLLSERREEREEEDEERRGKELSVRTNCEHEHGGCFVLPPSSLAHRNTSYVTLSSWISINKALEMTLILTKAELERMRAEARLGGSGADSKEQQRKAELKRLSNERVKNWPNTLEALRKKKESFIKEREEAEELLRQEQDREVRLLV